VSCTGIRQKQSFSLARMVVSRFMPDSTSTLTVYPDEPRTLSDMAVCKTMCKTKDEPWMSPTIAKNPLTASGDA
jgi:hypothetical protein